MLTEASTTRPLPRLPLGHPRALQHRDRVLRPPCRRPGRLALIYVDEDGGAHAHLVRRDARAVVRLRQCAEGRRPCRAATASRCSCRNRWNCRSRIWPRSAPAWSRCRCSRCSARTRWNFVSPIPVPGPSSPTRTGGKNSRKSATGCLTCRISTSPAMPLHAGAKSFWSSIETASEQFATVDTSADDPAIIIYTSGTTGNPKARCTPIASLLGHLPNVEMVHDFLPKPDDRDVDPGRLGVDRRAVRCAVPGLVSRRPGGRASRQKIRAAGGDAADGRSRRPQRVPAADRAEADAASRRQSMPA